MRTSQRMLQIGGEALARCSEGDDLRIQLAGLKRFTKLAEPIDTAAARRRVATVLLEHDGYRMPA